MSFETTHRSRRRTPLLAAAAAVVLLSCIAPAAAFAADGTTESADAAEPTPIEPAGDPALAAVVVASDAEAEAPAAAPAAAAPSAPPTEPAVGVGPEPVTQDGIEAIDDYYEVGPQPESSGGPVLHVGPPGILGNDVLPAGSAVTVAWISAPAHGDLDWYPDGWFEYAPDAGFSGTDSFQYGISTGVDYEIATVYIQVDGGTAPEPGGEMPAEAGGTDATGSSIEEVVATAVTPDGELAETGVDLTGTLLAALTALALGVAHLVFRRRTSDGAR